MSASKTKEIPEVKQYAATNYSAACPKCDEWYEFGEEDMAEKTVECCCGTEFRVKRTLK